MTNERPTDEFNWIADLVVAIRQLETRQLTALMLQYKGNGAAVSPSSTQLQRSLSLSTTDATHLSRNLERLASFQDVTARDVRVALATLAQACSARYMGEERVEVVCTAPSDLGVPVRATFATSLEMVRAAREEVLVVGYVVTEGAAKLIEQLAVARRDRRVSVTLVGNRIENQLITLRNMWPSGSPPPNILSRHADPSDEMSALHAKLLVCDRRAALVTSANFSHHGLHENIEIGVKIQSASVRQLVEFVEALIRTGEVEKVAW